MNRRGFFGSLVALIAAPHLLERLGHHTAAPITLSRGTEPYNTVRLHGLLAKVESTYGTEAPLGDGIRLAFDETDPLSWTFE